MGGRVAYRLATLAIRGPGSGHQTPGAEEPMNTRALLIIILLLLLIGALPTWPYSSEWGYYPSGGLGLILVILIILALVGRL